MCLPSTLCEDSPGTNGKGGRLAGGDFVIPPGTTSDVGVALTPPGKHVASGGGLDATVLVDLLDYGTVINTTNSERANFSLTSTDPPTFPADATSGCGGGVFVGPDTSCPFAKNVKKAYSKLWQPPTVRVFSPVTGQTYVMHCTRSDYILIVCRGGTDALVEFYYGH